MLLCKFNGNFILYAYKNTFMKVFQVCTLIKEEILRNEEKSILFVYVVKYYPVTMN